MTAIVTIKDILDLLPIVADREWSVQGYLIRDEDGDCPICALVAAIDPTSPYSTMVRAAFAHIDVRMNDVDRFIRAADSLYRHPVLREKILSALEMTE